MSRDIIESFSFSALQNRFFEVVFARVSSVNLQFIGLTSKSLDLSREVFQRFRVNAFLAEERILLTDTEFYALFYFLFYSTHVWGYLGVIGVVVLSIVLSKLYKLASPFLIIGLLLMTGSYFSLSVFTYTWHIFILVLGVIVLAFVGTEKI